MDIQIENDKIFLENHDKKIAIYEEPKNNIPIFISNISCLKYPMIGDNGGKITYFSRSFQMFLCSYIPSILSSPFIIKKAKLYDRNEFNPTFKEILH